MLVVDNEKLVGICTTNDFFYRILNPIFGIGEPGVRLAIRQAGEGKPLEDAISCINESGVRIRTLFPIRLAESNVNELFVHLDTEDAAHTIECLKAKGYDVEIRPR